jgi:hypothetical protein
MIKQGIIRVGTSLLFIGCCLVQAFANAATDVEEIEITGQRSSIQLRNIERQEAAMFALFNEFNSTDDFDISCRHVTHTGTLIPTWECEPAYLTNARQDNVYDFFTRAGAVLKTEAELKFENRVKAEQLDAEFKKVAREHPELVQAMLELNASKQRLAEGE